MKTLKRLEFLRLIPAIDAAIGSVSAVAYAGLAHRAEFAHHAELPHHSPEPKKFRAEKLKAIYDLLETFLAEDEYLVGNIV